MKYDVILVISAAAVKVSLADQVRKGTVPPLIFAAVAPRKPRGVGDLTARRDLIRSVPGRVCCMSHLIRNSRSTGTGTFGNFSKYSN